MISKIKDKVEKNYSLRIDEIKLLRDMIGYVCEISCGVNRYIVKLFRTDFEQQAKQSIDISIHLQNAGFCTNRMIPDNKGDFSFTINTEKGMRIGVLYEFINGREPNKENHIETLGEIAGKLHNTMHDYQGTLAIHDKAFFIDRYINLLRKMSYPKVDLFEQYGKDLWNRIESLPTGFYHGDFHTGNMLVDSMGHYTLFDYDAAGIASPCYDIATICDMTDYFDLSDKNFENGMLDTKKMMDRFLSGYLKYETAFHVDASSILLFIAIRHFDIQATIMESLGTDCFNNEFVDSQYTWLMKWREKALKNI